LVGLVSAFLAFFRQRTALQLEILALRHQLGVLPRTVKRPKRPKRPEVGGLHHRYERRAA